MRWPYILNSLTVNLSVHRYFIPCNLYEKRLRHMLTHVSWETAVYTIHTIAVHGKFAWWSYKNRSSPLNRLCTESSSIHWVVHLISFVDSETLVAHMEALGLQLNLTSHSLSACLCLCLSVCICLSAYLSFLSSNPSLLSLSVSLLHSPPHSPSLSVCLSTSLTHSPHLYLPRSPFSFCLSLCYSRPLSPLSLSPTSLTRLFCAVRCRFSVANSAHLVITVFTIP